MRQSKILMKFVRRSLQVVCTKGVTLNVPSVNVTDKAESSRREFFAKCWKYKNFIFEQSIHHEHTGVGEKMKSWHMHMQISRENDKISLLCNDSRRR